MGGVISQFCLNFTFQNCKTVPEYDRYKNIFEITTRFENSCQDVFLSREFKRQCLVFSFTAENFQKNKTERSLVDNLFWIIQCVPNEVVTSEIFLCQDTCGVKCKVLDCLVISRVVTRVVLKRERKLREYSRADLSQSHAAFRLTPLTTSSQVYEFHLKLCLYLFKPEEYFRILFTPSLCNLILNLNYENIPRTNKRKYYSSIVLDKKGDFLNVGNGLEFRC